MYLLMAVQYLGILLSDTIFKQENGFKIYPSRSYGVSK